MKAAALSRKVEATEADLETALSEIANFGDPADRAIGIVGGPATMLEAALLERDEQLFYLPGTAVNEARKAYPGVASRRAIRPTWGFGIKC